MAGGDNDEGIYSVPCVDDEINSTASENPSYFVGDPAHLSDASLYNAV